MKPRSDTNSKAKPQRRARHAGDARNAEHEEHREHTLSKELEPERPADRSATEKQSSVQGGEFR